MRVRGLLYLVLPPPHTEPRVTENGTNVISIMDAIVCVFYADTETFQSKTSKSHGPSAVEVERLEKRKRGRFYKTFMYRVLGDSDLKQLFDSPRSY